MKVYFELTNEDFFETLKFFSVDFSSTVPIVIFKEFNWEKIKSEYNSQDIRKLRLKVRKDSFYWVIKNNMPFEDLSIGFQCRIDRVPDIYNVDFWYLTSIWFGLITTLVSSAIFIIILLKLSNYKT